MKQQDENLLTAATETIPTPPIIRTTNNDSEDMRDEYAFEEYGPFICCYIFLFADQPVNHTVNKPLRKCD